MIKFDLLLKRMWTVLAVLFCTVVSTQAAWHVEYRIYNGAGEFLDQKFYDKEDGEKPVNYYYDATDPEYDECIIIMMKNLLKFGMLKILTT